MKEKISKKKTRVRILSFILTMVMMLGLAVPIYAADASARSDDRTVVGNGQGITFKLFDYNESINSAVSGLKEYFNFRGGSYMGAGNTVANYDEDGFTKNHSTVERKLVGKYPYLDFSRDALGDSKTDVDLTGDAESLGFLFGAAGYSNYVTEYTPKNTILQKIGTQYIYNSATNAVDYDIANQLFRVRNYKERNSSTAGYGSAETYYDFLPFNYTNGVVISPDGNRTYNLNSADVNYWFGMTMGVEFYQTKNGELNGDDMVFNFSGDDDVWVFVDDVLVLDLGGTHGTVSGSINFSTGEIEQYIDWNGTNGKTNYETAVSVLPESERTSEKLKELQSAHKYYPTTIRECFEKAGSTEDVVWNNTNTTFADYTPHTLKFFYLERGAGVANCKIDFNLVTIPENSVTVTKKVENLNSVLNASQSFDMIMWVETGVETEEYVKCATAKDLQGNEITFKDGIFSLKDTKSAVFTIPAGLRYYVEELDTSNYDVTFTNVGSLTHETNTSSDHNNRKSDVYKMNENSANVLVTNSAKDYSLTLNKVFDGPDDLVEDYKKAMDATFKLYLADGNGNRTETLLKEISYRDLSEGTYTFDDLLPGKYVIVEANNTSFESEKNIVIFEPVYIGNPAKIDDSTPITEITVTNGCQYKNKDLTISKKVTGNMGDINKAFDFKLTVKNDLEELYSGDVVVKKNSGESENITLENGEWNFTLVHGESVVITIPYGYHYTVEEADYTSIGYVTTFDGITAGSLTTDTAVTVENNKEAVPDTGIDFNNAPYVVMLLGVFFGLVAVIVSKRKWIG